jgi:hypothetical protein
MDSHSSKQTDSTSDVSSLAPSRRQKQLSVRSDKAFETAKWKAAKLGISVTEVVERALEQLPPLQEQLPEGLVRRGRFLVCTGGAPGPKTNDEVNELIERLRTDWADD